MSTVLPPGVLPRTVLVVDDNDANRYAVTYWLREAGFVTLEAASGAEALATANASHPDLVVLDVRLPDTTGFEVARHLRGTPITASIPILHLSASFTTSEWRTHGLEQGAEAYLTHPVEPREFVATVRSILRVRDVEEQLRAAADEAQRARREAEAAAARANALLGVTAALAGALTTPEVGGAATAEARRHTGASAALLAIHRAPAPDADDTLGDDPDGLALVGASGWTQPTPWLDALDARVRAGPLVLDSAAAMAAQLPEVHGALAEAGVRALVAVPVGAGGATSVAREASDPQGMTRGVLALLWTDADADVAPGLDASLVAAMAAPCTQALERARLFEVATRARTAAEAANRAKAQFLATMSHELRTPLNAILGYGELLALGIDGPVTDAQRGRLERMHGATQHLLALINDVLDLSKVDSGRLLLVRERGDAREAVRSAVALVEPQAAARRLSLTVECEGGVPFVGDVHRVGQILANVLANAVRFTEAGGTVTLACESVAQAPESVARRGIAGPWCAIHVRDSGIGIGTENLERIFEAYVQVDAGHTRRTGGTGLGLAISRRLARMMDGDITVTSRAGSGSTFTLWLPAAERPVGMPTPAGGVRTVRGLIEVGDALLRALPAIGRRYDARVRDDDAIPMARRVSAQELADHTRTLLTDIAQSLSAIEDARGAPAALEAIGSDIQRVIAEQHAISRAQLGWTHEAMAREWTILDEEVERALRAAIPPTSKLPVGEALELVRERMARARHVGFAVVGARA